MSAEVYNENTAQFITCPALHTLAAYAESCPYPLLVFTPDGTLVKVNKAFLNEFDLPDYPYIEGRYNVKKEPMFLDYGLKEVITRAFAGEALVIHDFVLPLHALRELLNIDGKGRETIFTDFVAIPIYDSEKQLAYVINLLLTKHINNERIEIRKATDIINSNYTDDFSIDNLARSVNLSRSYFCRLFKQHTGMTPHEYYINCKTEKLKQALADTNKTVEQAFKSCGVKYHGYYARIFREKTGLTPSQFRKHL